MKRRFVVCLFSGLLAAALSISPTHATVASHVPKGAIDLGNGAYAVELKKDTPDWYTPELHARVVAAGKKGQSVPLPESAEVPQSALLFTGIRPGSWMISPSWCTLNFVFGGVDSVGTAGHCTGVGEEVTIVAAPGVLMNIGKTVTSVDNGIGDDFALIDVYPAMEQHVNPSMAIVAGPTGARPPRLGDAIVHVGHGVVIGTGGTARPGVVTYPNFPVVSDLFRQNKSDADAYGWNGAIAPGDSGSAARAVGGEAVGNVTHIVVGTSYVPATNAGTTITRILQIAGQPLSTASLVPDPLGR
ncbi:MAG: S1 family peptidase [Actinomycetota bacterium]|nr:S1 family peptidase [Actinomycetota bacterium]